MRQEGASLIITPEPGKTEFYVGVSQLSDYADALSEAQSAMGYVAGEAELALDQMKFTVALVQGVDFDADGLSTGAVLDLVVGFGLQPSKRSEPSGSALEVPVALSFLRSVGPDDYETTVNPLDATHVHVYDAVNDEVVVVPIGEDDGSAKLRRIGTDTFALFV